MTHHFFQLLRTMGSSGEKTFNPDPIKQPEKIYFSRNHNVNNPFAALVK